MKLVNRIEISKPEETYNLHIKDDHNYIVNNAVVSNCHGAKADVLQTMLGGVMSRIPIRWGLTGTIPKEPYEYTGLLVSIGKVIHKVSAKSLQDKKVLADCHVNIVQLIDHYEFKKYQDELKYLLGDKERIACLAKLINNIKESGNTLVLIDRVEAGKELTKLIDNSIFISGATKVNDRKEEYDDIAISDNRTIIATYGIASVGINIPRIFNMVLIEPGKSFVKVIQSIGRGIRRAEDKDFVQIWDFTSSCKFSKRHLTTRKKFYAEAQYPYSIEKYDWK